MPTLFHGTPRPHSWLAPLLGFALLLGFSLGLGPVGITLAQEIPQNPTSENQSAQSNPLRDLNSYFPFDVPPTLASWEARKIQLRKHLLVTQGLWPIPPAPQRPPIIHGLIDQGDYTIEKVYFESLPGFYVTGNLYKPKNITGKIPGILSPHGHHANGRFLTSSEKEIDSQIAQGAESFRSNAKSILQARCANLARMGCVVFHYDMIGYADSQQLNNALIHGFSKQRPAMTGAKSWGLFSPQAESNLQTAMGLQTLNSIRSLDFLAALPEVDPTRLGVTGCSGGGTQTFMLCAIDDRPAAAFPAVMVSTAMQGGCTCENCSYLRAGTGNVEIAAMFAPKPMGLTAADDWTKEMKTKGFPELQQLYALYGKDENVQLTSRTEFGHNFNQVSREAMYRWFKKHLKFSGDPVETEIEFVEPSELSVFDSTHPRPAGGIRFERELTMFLARQNNERLTRKLLDSDSTSQDFENEIGTFVDVVMETATVSIGKIELVEVSVHPDHPDRIRFKRQFTHGGSSVLTHAGPDDVGLLFVEYLDESVLEQNDNPQSKLVQECRKLGIGAAVRQNDTLSTRDRSKIRRVNNPREALAYTIGYNAPEIAKRAHVLVNEIGNDVTKRFLVATGKSSLQIALNAKRLRDEANVLGLVVQTDGIRFQNIGDIWQPELLPGAAKYLDLPGLLSLAAPKPMLLIGEDKQSASVIVRSYEAAGKPENLTLITTIPAGKTKNEVIIAWLNNQMPSPETKREAP